MKKQRLFSGIILIGFGAYFLLQQLNLSAVQPFLIWPTLLIIIGLAFLFEGYGAKDNHSILPGVILTGFGLHFHMVDRLAVWPDNVGIFILIIALGLLLQSLKTGVGFFQGILFLILAFLYLFYDRVIGWFDLLGNGVASAWKFWPALLILFGIYLLFIKRK